MHTPDDTTPDEDLMRRFQRGDARAFPELVRRHRGAVFAFVLRWTQDRARAEDILQETWLKVVRASVDWSPRARFTTWLYTIARNACVDGARRERARAAEPLEAERLPAEGGDPERAAASAELRPVLESAIAGLPDAQREVFLLREMAGIPFHEIARITGAPEPTVKSRMRYALEALRSRLTEAGVDAPAGGQVA
ncbi:MAG: RNA polymerase sigma factor [Myxococcaceae bacterium]